MQSRLDHETFQMDCDLPVGRAGVHFPRDWPGVVAAMFPRYLRQLAETRDEVPGSFIAVHLETRTAIGQLGTVGQPDAAGAQEIGYGLNPDARGHGFAPEAVLALATHLLESSDISDVTAYTATANSASSRVLEKAGFHRTGTSRNMDDGDLDSWAFQARCVRVAE